jgi:hypothetical protein
MHPILQKLSGGDRRSIGRSDEVVAEVLADPSLFGPLFEGLTDADPLIRMRSADAVEKITRQQPAYLQPYQARLLQQVAHIEQPEVRWHVAQLFSRLTLEPAEYPVVLAILAKYLTDQSKIVKTCAMQALAHLAEQEARLRPGIISQLETLTASGSPAMQSRGRKLLARLKSFPLNDTPRLMNG